MPVRLTSREYKIIGIVVLVSAVSLSVGVKYFWRAFPEAAIEFRVNRADSLPLAQRFLAERGIHLEGYRHAAIFTYDDQAKVYLERTQGLERMNGLTRGPIRLWRWSHRWFKPQQQEEFSAQVTPGGEIVGFNHEIPEAAPGANLEQSAGRQIAEQFLREAMKRDLNDLEFVEAESEKRPARTDHSFTWKQKSVNLGDGSLRIAVSVAGDQVDGYGEFVKIPEQWSRDYRQLRSRNQSAQLVAEVFFILLTASMLIILVMRLRDRDVPLRLSVIFGLVGAVLYFLGRLNNLPLEVFGYQTTDSYSSFMAGYLRDSVLFALGVGVWIFFLVAGSEPVYRENHPRHLSLRRYLSWTGLRSRSFFMSNVIGIGMTFFFFAYQTVFYLAANKLGAWAPADVQYSDLLNTRFPWVWVLFIGFLPAVSEEMQFRAFAIPFLRQRLRSRWLAVVFAAFMWGFLHAAYPNQPFFIRGVEVGMAGIIVGVLMLRFGILATLIWHYSVDAIYTAFLLLRSSNNYLMISGLATAGIMLVPFVISLVAYLRAGSFTEEEALTNQSQGISRAPQREAALQPEKPLAYRSLDRRRLILAGVLTAALLGVLFIPVHRFGEGTELRVARGNALRLADVYLRQRQVDPDRYRHVAWLHRNVDPMALRYILERRSLAETDRIYRSATRLLLWEVRYFRPLEKEEHLIFIDPADGAVYSYRHLLDENAPGAALSTEEARALGERFLKQQGYDPARFTLQDSQVEKRKARSDYTLVWQAKAEEPGTPRQIDDAHFRLQVNIAGDQVVGLSRFFKLPEEWVRQREATGLHNIVLTVVSILVLATFLAGALILFVKRVRGGQIPWRRAAKVGALVYPMLLLFQLNQLSTFYSQYDTSISLANFTVLIGVGMLVVPLLGAMLAWLLVGLATSLYPDAWRVLRGSARAVWRRDAAVAMLVSLTALAALDRLDDLIATRFHAFAPVSIGLVPDLFDAFSPGAGFLLRGLIYCVFVPALAGILIYLVTWALRHRPWWMWLVLALLLAGLGSSRAHSLPEYAVTWAQSLVALIVAAGIVAAFFRDNVLAYVGAAFAYPIVEPLIVLLSQPAQFLRWNGIVLLLMGIGFLGWLLIAVKKPASSLQT
jgi:membrane protease YdiL (CAAX protease family)